MEGLRNLEQNIAITPSQRKEIYDRGENISAVLRREKGTQFNTTEIIEIAYDLQAGSYIATMRNEEMVKHKADYSAEIARIILSLCKPASILEAGIGEATTFSGVLKCLDNKIGKYGFDLSWSRIAFAKIWLHEKDITDCVLCTGNLLDIPFISNSIDVVYTSHSIEPNGGNEEPILRELYRVARKYLILLEPGYEFASDEGKLRMDSHGYCKDLKKIALALDYDIIEHKLFPFISNPLNPTVLTIIRKGQPEKSSPDILACPKFKTPLKKIGEMLYSPEAMTVYPIIDEIPCLRIENGILASKYEDIFRARLLLAEQNI